MAKTTKPHSRIATKDGLKPSDGLRKPSRPDDSLFEAFSQQLKDQMEIQRDRLSEIETRMLDDADVLDEAEDFIGGLRRLDPLVRTKVLELMKKSLT